MTEREFAISVVKQLRAAGHEALWAGGCVRDELLHLVPKDYDIATEATPEQVAASSAATCRWELALASFASLDRAEQGFLEVEGGDLPLRCLLQRRPASG